METNYSAINKIDKNKLYSMRAAFSLMPQYNSETLFQRAVHKDLENGNTIFKTIVIKVKNKNKYFIKGENIINNLK